MTDMTTAPISVERLRELLAMATPGPWMLATSCSWRRILSVHGESVIVPITQRHDNHPDLSCGDDYVNAELAVAAVNALPSLLQQLAEREAEVGRLRGLKFSDRNYNAMKSRMEAAERAREECVALVSRIVHDPVWRTNDNTLWPDLTAFLAANGGDNGVPDNLSLGLANKELKGRVTIERAYSGPPAHGDGEVLAKLDAVILSMINTAGTYWSGSIRQWANDLNTIRPLIATRPAPTAEDAGVDAANARRYRWLRERDVLNVTYGVPHIAVPASKNHGEFLSEEDADAAIDAALATETPQARGEGNG